MLIYEFLKALSITHQCMADIEVINGVAKYSYQGPSPDEVALV